MAYTQYLIWVNWKEEAVALYPAAGFEPLPFVTEESWQENLRILLSEGFRAR